MIWGRIFFFFLFEDDLPCGIEIIALSTQTWPTLWEWQVRLMMSNPVSCDCVLGLRMSWTKRWDMQVHDCSAVMAAFPFSAVLLSVSQSAPPLPPRFVTAADSQPWIIFMNIPLSLSLPSRRRVYTVRLNQLSKLFPGYETCGRACHGRWQVDGSRERKLSLGYRCSVRWPSSRFSRWGLEFSHRMILWRCCQHVSLWIEMTSRAKLREWHSSPTPFPFLQLLG